MTTQQPLKDRIIERDEGFYARVNGIEYGAWRSHAEARAGLEVEQRRAAAKRALRYPDATSPEPPYNAQ